jgi:hypothetical protein
MVVAASTGTREHTMTTSQNRKRLEIPAALYADLARDAARIGLSTQAYATSLITRGLAADRIREQVPFRYRDGQANDVVRSAQQDRCAHEWDDKGRAECYCLKCGYMLVRAE